MQPPENGPPGYNTEMAQHTQAELRLKAVLSA